MPRRSIYRSFEAFFEIYWPHNNLLWEQYRNNEIDRQTLIIERFRYMLRPLGIEDTKSVLAINNDFLQRTTRKTRLVPGAIELLEYLRPSYRMYILSNGFREVQFKKLCNSGLAPYYRCPQFQNRPAMAESERAAGKRIHTDLHGWKLGGDQTDLMTYT